MNSIPATGTSPARRGAYFFLSYAHSAPPTDESTDTDHWVRVCYEDLTEAVRHLAQPTAGLSAGFIDDLIQTGSDWNAALGDALAVAEVFVALYSPGYFNKSWPLRERESFLHRLREIEGATDKQRHILPVLWIPLFSWETTAEIREASQLGGDVPAYAENGLRALCMLPSYQAEYRIILDRMARRIVDVAENSPVGPSWVPPPEDVKGAFATETQFVVAVVAPTKDRAPSGRGTRTYGEKPWQWRPFADKQTLPLAQYVANTAERLGLPTQTVTLADKPQSVGETAAVVLVDPWIAADQPGRAQLTTTLATLPDWVIPLVVVNRKDPQYEPEGAALVRSVADMLSGFPALPVIEAQDLQQFVDAVPVLVTEARRRYLKLGPAYTPKGHTIGGTPGDLQREIPPQNREQADG
jgi:FxsC-like protein